MAHIRKTRMKEKNLISREEAAGVSAAVERAEQWLSAVWHSADFMKKEEEILSGFHWKGQGEYLILLQCFVYLVLAVAAAI